MTVHVCEEATCLYMCVEATCDVCVKRSGEV